MLVDTSAWIEFFNPVPNPHQTALEDHIFAGEIIYTCPIIVQEVLQGVRQKDYVKTRSALSSAEMLTFTNYFQMAVDAAQVYRACRIKGLTIRKANDCLIAHYALKYDLPLLHKDKDFDSIAKVFPLRIVKV